MPPHLTDRDEEVLKTLTLRVRCITASIAAIYFWTNSDGGTRSAAQRFSLLEAAGWLFSEMRFAKSLPRLTQPLAVWTPGESEADFGKLSYVLKHRFNFAATSSRIYIATAKAANRYGGIGERPPRNSETSHDLGLAQVYLELRLRIVSENADWISEGKLASKRGALGTKLPDAVIRRRGGDETVIEFGGEYSKKKLREFHLHCEKNSLGYEVW